MSSLPTEFPSLANDTVAINITESFKEAEKAEAEHAFDAQAAFTLNVTIIGCLLLAYVVKRFRIYSLPESAGALLVGVIVGGMARLTVGAHNLDLFEFQPEVFFFFLLPPIMFEAGYSLDRKGFLANIGAITLYAFFGTIVSTFVVGYLLFYASKIGLVNLDSENPMEALIFGSLISAVDPVATLSIMGNEELGVDPLLYSLVFGESVLNDAIAISLFKTFFGFYNPENVQRHVSYPAIIVSFMFTTGMSILVGVGLGLGASWLFKHTDLKVYPKLETSLLLCFCYLCYAAAESIELSGIMALFFQGVVLSHYNAYNLSMVAHVATEQIFSTFATYVQLLFRFYGSICSLLRSIVLHFEKSSFSNSTRKHHQQQYYGNYSIRLYGDGRLYRWIPKLGSNAFHRCLDQLFDWKGSQHFPAEFHRQLVSRTIQQNHGQETGCFVVCRASRSHCLCAIRKYAGSPQGQICHGHLDNLHRHNRILWGSYRTSVDGL